MLSDKVKVASVPKYGDETIYFRGIVATQVVSYNPAQPMCYAFLSSFHFQQQQRQHAD